MKDSPIKTHIRWFSATGNSLAAARALAQGLGAASCEPLLSPRGGRAEEGPGRYVFVFPLFYLGMPKAVEDTIGDFPLAAGDDLCAVVTRGVRRMGAVLGASRRLLRERGARLRCGAYIDMPINDVTLFSVKPEEDNKRKLALVPARIERISRIIAGGKTHFDPEPSFFMGRARRKAYRSRILASHDRFYANPSCSGCGICARVCPLGRIEMSGGKPSWKAGCQECEACINLCPSASIQYRGVETERKARYRHPEVGWEDIAAQRG
jgi:ferredoxin